MTQRRRVTIVIHRDGDVASRSYRMPLTVARVGLVLLAVFAVIVIVGGILYAPIVRSAATVPGLRDRIARLEAENAQVRDLARSLADAESRYEQIRGMLGGDIVRAVQPTVPGPLPAAVPILVPPPGAPSRYEDSLSVPTHWPLDSRGVVTRGQVSPGVRDETHTGLDIAVPVGTPIRASGGGVVAELGQDAEYGRYVMLAHPSQYETLYGHASRLLVAIGDTVKAGQVIALSGSTGRSTGPHLHFEVRRSGRAVDPRTIVKEGT